MIVDKHFVACLHHTSWQHISLGFHVDFESPNLEIHLPFCFIRFGWEGVLAPPYNTKGTWGIQHPLVKALLAQMRGLK
jgi:hypothetical protein